ncbi:MAG: peptide chain release factor 1 [Solirubrobacterales bacterium]|nr:peptide chain release factor 1 [Solirubrobacterales bacterium]
MGADDHVPGAAAPAPDHPRARPRPAGGVDRRPQGGAGAAGGLGSLGRRFGRARGGGLAHRPSFGSGGSRSRSSCSGRRGFALPLGVLSGPGLGLNSDGVIDELVSQIKTRFSELQEELSDPAVIGDRQHFAAASRAYRELEPAARLASEYRRAADDAEGARELLAEDGDDSELRAMLDSSRARMAELEDEIRLAMVERDPNDDKNVIVEIRPGAGGDEAALWAGDLYRMLTRYAERRGFQVEPLSIGEGTYTFAVKGAGAYSVFKFEGGTHRVQRVPETESQGRIHTSTATVAVLPEAEDVEVEIDPGDLQIDVYRSSGPGGQSVNTTDSAVRITHKPSGIVVSMQDEKSQLQNRERAMRVLRARLYERARAEQQAAVAASRAAQVGTGERAEKIRTYNFPERRVTDHRVGMRLHNLDAILIGELDELTAALQDDEKRRRLEEKASVA